MCPSTNELPFSFSTQECTLQRPHLEFLSCSSACSQGRQSNPACHVSAPVPECPGVPPTPHPPNLLHASAPTSAQTTSHPHLQLPLPFSRLQPQFSSSPRCERTLQTPEHPTHAPLPLQCLVLNVSAPALLHPASTPIQSIRRSLFPPPTLLLHASAPASAQFTLFHPHLHFPPPFERLQLQKLSSSPRCGRTLQTPEHPTRVPLALQRLVLNVSAPAFLHHDSAPAPVSEIHFSFPPTHLHHAGAPAPAPEIHFAFPSFELVLEMLARQLLHLR